MKSSAQLCSERLRLQQGRASPFARAISLGYYDGSTSGVLECGTCSEIYRYEMIDSDARDLRVFALAPMPKGSLDELALACSVLGQPRWPMWSPVWRFKDESEKNRVQREVDRLLAMATPVQVIVA